MIEMLPIKCLPRDCNTITTFSTYSSLLPLWLIVASAFVPKAEVYPWHRFKRYPGEARDTPCRKVSL